MTTNRIALVLGATGGVGGETAAALLREGWTVRGLARDVDKAKASWPHAVAAVDWRQGDALEPASVLAAAQGASLLVHAVNPPGYKDWDKLVVPMLESTIAAAKATGARIVLPGTLYNYGPDAFPVVPEDAPQHPISHKGELRVQMEAMLERAAASGAKVLIVRAGDFFGPHAGNNWFSQGLVKPGQPLTAVTNPGTKGVGHQWSYLPDVAQAIAQLADREDQLGAFENVHLGGHYDADGTQLVEAVRRVAGKKLTVRSFPWWLVRLTAPFVRIFGEMSEMRYLWRTDIRMSNARVRELLGSEPHTPLDEAVRTTLRGLRCLP